MARIALAATVDLVISTASSEEMTLLLLSTEMG